MSAYNEIQLIYRGGVVRNFSGPHSPMVMSREWSKLYPKHKYIESIISCNGINYEIGIDPKVLIKVEKKAIPVTHMSLNIALGCIGNGATVGI